MNLSQLKVMHEAAALFTLNSARHHLSSPLWIPRGTWKHPLKKYGFICNAVLFICVHAHKAL